MSYNIKYYSTFKDISNNTYLINLRKLDYSGATTELISAIEPLVIDTPSTGKFEAVKGSGATLKFISETDRQLIDLYTANYKEWQVEILINGSTFFTGYVESELYEESFNFESNYEVSITCNNGIGILSREKYINPGGTNITGLTSVFDIISTIVTRLELDYSALNIATDLSINSTSVASNKSILQYIAANNENYVDEDNAAFDCRKVLESVLNPLSLSFFIDAGKIWIVDTEYLQNTTVNYKSFSITNNAVSSTCTNLSTGVNLDLNSLIKFDSGFTIQAGFNDFKISKNRYVKEIIEKVDFSDEENVTGGDNVWKVQYDSIINTNNDNESAPKRWLNEYTSFKDFYNNTAVTPNKSTNTLYYPTTPDEICFAGGIKPVKEVDSLEINWNVDDNSFTNWLIINNPLKAFVDSPLDNGYTVQESFFTQNNSGQLDRLSLKYTGTIPYMFNSDSVNINLNFTSLLFSVGIVGRTGNTDAVIKPLSDYPADYSYIVARMKICLKNSDGTTAYFLQNSNYNATSENSVHPDVDSIYYNWVAYTGQSDTFCNYIIHNINEAGNGTSLLDVETNNTLPIPANFDNIKKLDVEFYNTFYGVYYIAPNLPFHLKEFKMYKETAPYLCYRDIFTTVSNGATGDEISLNDEEIEYYLSDTYKTESESLDLLNYTAENRYITDVAGLMISNNSTLSSLYYITSVSANGETKTNIEDLIGDKYIRQYQNNQIVLSVSIKSSSISLFNTFTLASDTFWSGKKWVVTAINNDVASNRINLTLEEIY